jgi:hypothetical protein
LTRIFSVPPLLIDTAPVVELNNPVVASPLRSGLVTDDDVPRAFPTIRASITA